MLGVGVGFELRTFCIFSLRAKIVLACLGAKTSFPLNEPIQNVLHSNLTPTPNMHQKLTAHGTYCMQNNQLPTKSTIEPKDNPKTLQTDQF